MKQYDYSIDICVIGMGIQAKNGKEARKKITEFFKEKHNFVLRKKELVLSLDGKTIKD